MQSHWLNALEDGVIVIGNGIEDSLFFINKTSKKLFKSLTGDGVDF